MTKTYSPREGTLPQRLIAHLQSVGAPIRSGEITTLFGTPSNNISNLLKPAVQHGLLERVGSGREVTYCLAGESATAPGATPSTQGERTKRGTAGRAAAAKVAKKKATARAVRVKEPEAPPPTPICALWDDGDYVLCNVDISDDGQVILPEPRARQLYLFLHRQFATEARTQ